MTEDHGKMRSVWDSSPGFRGFSRQIYEVLGALLQSLPSKSRRVLERAARGTAGVPLPAL